MTALHRVAHRGYSAVAPENTLPALAAGVLAGATFIEFDVRTTADGVPVVIHDKTVDRTTDGSGAVAELAWGEIAPLDAGSWFSPAYAGVTVPLLNEVLDLLAARAEPIELLLEIKPPASAGEVETILGQVREHGLLPQTVVQSFDLDVVRLTGEVVPEVRRGLLRHGFDEDQVTVAKELGLDYCNPRLSAVLDDPATVADLSDNGVGVMPWTANDPGQWPALVEAGVAGLITDHTGTLTGWSRA
jgi:glycerophosphoryl diester phosphodiesterase